MPRRRRLLVLVVGLVLALLAGCSSGGEGDREAGDPVTEDEAALLAGLLARNAEEGGADFLVTAPYQEGALLTLTGEVDFTGGAGRAQAVTSYGDGRADDVRTVFFTRDQLWFGDVPGLTEALAASGLPEAAYVRRPSAADGEQPPLTDVLVLLVLNLAAEEADDPAAFRGGDYTWEGQRSIDGELTTVFGSPAGWQVAVDSSSELLVQYLTRLADEDFDVTVSLSDHGEREITPPADEESVDAAAHPEVAAAVGV
ncbi:hypothetical protein [Blastococcus sp. SYSU D00820]